MQKKEFISFPPRIPLDPRKGDLSNTHNDGSPIAQRTENERIGVTYCRKKRGNFSIPPSSALVGIRTPNLLIRSEMLYPIELQMHFRFRCFVNGLQK